MSTKQEWQPIETAPKYPIDINYRSPKFLALTAELDIKVAWWAYPHPLSQNYKDNRPPSVEYLEKDMLFTLRPTHWMPLPEPPQPEPHDPHR